MVISLGLYFLLDFLNRPLRIIFDLLPLFAAFEEYIATLFKRVVVYKMFEVLKQTPWLKCHNCILIYKII